MTGSSLAPWVCGPLVGLVAVWLAIRATPSLECGEGIDRSSQETVLLVFTGIASLGTAWAGALRLGALRGEGRWRSLRDPALVVLTPITLVGLLVAWARGDKVEDARILTPVYLLGAALCYPAITLVWLFLTSGLGC